jgi:hypothetical protein
MQKEEWKPVSGYEGLYEVSNFGRVRSLKTGIMLRLNNRGLEYRSVLLCKKDLANKSLRVHRLVAQAFIPNPENKPCVNHIDNNPNNNRVSNLEWVTPKENYQHSQMQGRNSMGEKVGTSKLKERDVLEIRKLFETGQYTKRLLSRMYRVTSTMVFYIVNRKSWKHI